MHRSPLHHDRCFTLLSGTADPGSPLHSLCGDVSILSMILHLVLPEWRRQAQQIDLFDAAKNGRMSELREKLHLTDADVNFADWVGRTTVHMAAVHGHIEAVRLLLQFGGDPNKSDKHGHTAVHNAARHGHSNALQLLLHCGGDPNKGDGSGDTPVFWATRTRHADALQVLLQCGGDPNKTNDHGATAMTAALFWDGPEALGLLEAAGGKH